MEEVRKGHRKGERWKEGGKNIGREVTLEGERLKETEKYREERAMATTQDRLL